MKRFVALLGIVLIAVPAMAANLTAGNILVSESDDSNGLPRTVAEFTRTGTFVQRFTVPKPANAGAADYMQDVEADESLNFHCLNGTLDAALSSYNFAIPGWVHRYVPYWSTGANGNDGTMAIWKNYAFLIDLGHENNNPLGVIRYNLTTDAWIRFDAPGVQNNAPQDICTGLDGLIYVLEGRGSPSGRFINVYDPETLDLVRTIDIAGTAYGNVVRGICVDADGYIYLGDGFGPIHKLDPSGAFLVTKTYTRSGAPHDWDLSADGVLMVAQSDGRVTLLQTPGLTEIRSFKTTAATNTGGYGAHVPLPAPPNFQLQASKVEMAGQNSAKITVTLDGPAPANTTFAVSDTSSYITTPSSLVVQAGKSSAYFFTTVQAVNFDVLGEVRVKLSYKTKAIGLTLKALVPTAMSLTPNPVVGGSSVSGRVVINGVAGPSGRVVSITDNSSYCTSPGNITVPSGAASANFTLTTLPVTAQQNVTIRAAVSVGFKTATLRITP